VDLSCTWYTEVVPDRIAVRQNFVQVPVQYNPAVPASLMVWQDGQAFMAPDGDIRAERDG
jgi:hypothetical protein